MSTFPENPGQSDSVRDALRRSRLVAREAMTEEEHHLASTLIEEALFQHLANRVPGLLAFCWPIRREFDPLPLLARLCGLGWRACMPVVVAPNAPMAFHEWSPQAAMKPGYYDIPVPVVATPVHPDLVLLPLVAFDSHCYRLGYGGGYFDRTLAALTPQPITIGIGFELARVDSISPETHDVALDYVVTEAGIFACPD
ncbi:MAG TPA: 5-formyltetrahydrofolate cyclo-ligase [Rhodocyclaceae bacterium]